MIYFNAFITCGAICLIAQIIYDNSKWTPGHITTMFVVIGAFLDLFHIYDKIVEFAGMGAMIPITSFGHSLMHATMSSSSDGFLSMVTGMFDMVTTGITAAIFFAFITAILCKPKS